MFISENVCKASRIANKYLSKKKRYYSKLRLDTVIKPNWNLEHLKLAASIQKAVTIQPRG
jgi:hypothetical protein